MSETPGNHGVARDSDAVGVGQHDRALQKSALLYPGSAGHFAVAIQREIAGEDGIVHGIAPTGKKCRHASSDRTFADFELTLPADESGVANFHSGNIGNGIE